jgi:hypothetical protein
MFEDLNVWMFECLCLSIAGLNHFMYFSAATFFKNQKLEIGEKCFFSSL